MADYSEVRILLIIISASYMSILILVINFISFYLCDFILWSTILPACTHWLSNLKTGPGLPSPANYSLWKPLEVQTLQALGPRPPSATLGLVLWAPFSVLALSQVVSTSAWNLPPPRLLIPLLPP